VTRYAKKTVVGDKKVNLKIHYHMQITTNVLGPVIRAIQTGPTIGYDVSDFLKGVIRPNASRGDKKAG
jgi:hypothetical protein